MTAALLTATQAAEYTGYGTAAKFRRAVMRGKMPRAHDTNTRPVLWSRAEIDALLTPTGRAQTDPDSAKLDKVLGLA